MDCEGDEVLLLRGHPVPVLGEEARVVGPPGERCAAVAEEAEGDLCAYVEGQDVREGDVGALSDAWRFG
jgi:hypothetical protein